MNFYLLNKVIAVITKSPEIAKIPNDDKTTKIIAVFVILIGISLFVRVVIKALKYRK